MMAMNVQQIAVILLQVVFIMLLIVTIIILVPMMDVIPTLDVTIIHTIAMMTICVLKILVIANKVDVFINVLNVKTIANVILLLATLDLDARLLVF